MNRQFYDVAFKMSVSNEYQAGNETYATLAHKYNVPRSTIASWIRKANKFEILSKKETKMTPGFFEYYAGNQRGRINFFSRRNNAYNQWFRN